MNLKSEQWKELETKFPGAYSFILQCQLKNEYKDLKEELQWSNKEERKHWIESRIKELELLPYITE